MAEADLSKLRIDRSGTPGALAPRRRVPSWVIGAVIIAALVGAYLVRSLNAPLAVEPATVSSAYPSVAFAQLNATGYVVAQRKAAVASKATGRLEWLGVREGSRVRQGEVIARLENRDVTAALEQAAASIKVAQANLEQGEAELNEAERSLRRSRELLARNFVSQAAHDGAVARHEKASAGISGFKAAIGVAQANHRAAQIAIDQTLIRAPFDGVVLTKNANVGDMSALEVEADVSESNLGKVTPGQPCEIQLDALPEVRFGGRLLRLVPTVDRTKATVMAKIRFEKLDPRILPEMSAKVAFLSQEMPEGERSARTVVQPPAVVQRDGKSVMFLIRDGKAVQVAVETGARIGELLEIRSGVKPGDRVVLRPPDKLHDGARIALPAK